MPNETRPGPSSSRTIQAVVLAVVALAVVAAVAIPRLVGDRTRDVVVLDTPSPSHTPSLSPTPTPTPTPTPAPLKLCDATIGRAPASTFVVRSKHQLPFDDGSAAGALFAWDPAADKETRLTPEDGKRRALVSYRASRLWYVVWTKNRFAGASSLCAADVRTGTVTDVLDLGTTIQAYDVDASGERVAYLVRTPHTYETHARRLADGTDTVLASGAVRPDEQPLNYDAQRVAWSPDGSAILINDTFAREKGFRIVRPDGSDVIPARDAADSAFWRSGHVVYAPFGEGQGAPKDWFDLDPATGATTAYRANGGRYRGALSPDGTKIAYDLAPSHSSMYDLEKKGLTPDLGGNKAALMWLNDRQLLATETTCCAGWQPQGRGLIIDVNDLGRGWRRAWIRSTFDAAVVAAGA